MTNLFGDLARQPGRPKPGLRKTAPSRAVAKAQPLLPTPGSPQPAGNVQQLANQAVQEFEEYQRLTSQGKLAEAGQKLEQHKRTLEELKRAARRRNRSSNCPHQLPGPKSQLSHSAEF